MNPVFELLMVAGLIGAVDVVGFHLVRFRLWSRPESMFEEITHLLRHVIFVAVTLLLVWAPHRVDVLLGLGAIDLVNSSADVLLERASRRSVGGVPPLETLLHVLASTVLGATIAAAVFADPVPLTDGQVLRGLLTAALGTALFVVEGGLFATAIASRRTACCALAR